MTVTWEDEIIVRAKWSIDGANTLSEAAQMSRDFAKSLETLEQNGYQFHRPVDDDYGFATPNGETPESESDTE